ncbi:hypothetical protein Kisp02_35450 [Kineosporia sp. NBRC 101731]|nr:hypothetical protein Kisp02_35450 [Kineosporia sp. NBRC 101731]
MLGKVAFNRQVTGELLDQDLVVCVPHVRGMVDARGLGRSVRGLVGHLPTVPLSGGRLKHRGRCAVQVS